MKTLFTFTCIFLLSIPVHSQEPTYSGLPDSSHVLVVYNGNSTLSDSVMQLYVDARNIPGINVVGLSLPSDTLITYQGETHLIELVQQGEIIRDMNNENSSDPTIHSWLYFNKKIAIPITEWLETHYVNGTPLRDIIRFIVLCKGVPFRIDARQEDADSRGTNVICANLLTHLGETMEDPDALLFYYNKTPGIINPYHNVDPNFSMEHHFLPNHYQTTWEGRTIKLSYLVTHLSAPRFSDIQEMIDRSLNAINENNYDWFIDAKEEGALTNDANATKAKFENLVIENYYFETTDERITEHERPVITYSSDGTWAGFDPDYIQTQLYFEYADGAFFNTWESHNGLSIGTYPVIRTRGQGLLADFTLMGGTVGVGQAFHSTGSHVIENYIFFPSYAIGYTFIEAAYLGLSRLDATNVVVGDPLTIIYDCQETIISSNTTIGPGDYSCDIIVPEGITLTIASSAVVNFKRNSTLRVSGNLIIESNAVINFNNYSHLFLDEDSEIIVQQNGSVHFNNRSTFFVYRDFNLDENSPFYFGISSNIVSDGSFEISGNLILNMSSITINGSCDLSESSTLSLGVTYFKINETLTLNENSQLNMNSASLLEVNGSFTLSQGSVLNINGQSSLNIYGKLYLNEGTTINQNNSSVIAIKVFDGVFISRGSISNPVTINYSSTSINQLVINGIDTLLLSYTIINPASINLSISDGIQKPRLISITNSTINSTSTFNKNIFNVTNTVGVNATFSDNRIDCNNAPGSGMEIIGFNSVQLLRNIIQNTGTGSSGNGILIKNNKVFELRDCEILNFKNGIVQGRVAGEETELINNEDIRIYSCTIQGRGYDQEGTGILLGYDPSIFTLAAKIDLNNISGFSSCIAVNNPNNFPVGITNNTLSNYRLFGISLAGGNDAIITGNIITVDEPDAVKPIGISVNLVNNPLILDNPISAEGVTDPGDGIFSVSSGGEIRNNTIQYNYHGIELSSSSPNVGANIITDNLRYGIYINDNSHPDLSEQIVGGDPYPLSGYNTIRENGKCNVLPSYSELYLANRSTVNLEKGCNTIADDRDDPALHCNYLYLIDGHHVVGKVNAFRNYWGEVNGGNPVGRFGPSLNVNYGGWQTGPCTYTEIGSALLLANSQGEVYDTIYASGETLSELTEIESRYAEANDYYYNNQYAQAKQEYQGIIEDYGDSTESLQAYNRLYTLENLMNSSTETFNQLKDYYLQKAGNQTDSIMIGTLTHLSDLCLVSATEYLTAINNFDEEAQQNPNTDIALYRQIDALTTSLLMPQDSTMNKGILGKYSVNGLSDYTNKLSELIKTRGKSGLESEEKLLPTEYTLYQNYPNPFNPTTTIKYDLPNTSDVSLIIYDILGRKVKELVNTKQQAGRYEIQFNASSLASGVYIYQLRTDKYVNTKKMILLK